MSVKAIAKGVRISPRKVGEVAALVRGRTVSDAITILEHTPRRAAVAVRKTIQSAQANASYNHNYLPDTLYISEISVTPGPRRKAYRPVAHGIAHPYLHRSSHIRVIVEGQIRKPKKPAAKAEKQPSPDEPATADKKEDK
jgi:large subunit ribosomal protein L22